MTYRAEPITQRDGSPLANSNCLMAAAAVGLDYETGGAKTSTGAKMRDYSGDTSGGTNTDEIERAWHTGYDEDPLSHDGQPWDKVLDDLRGGRLVMLQVWHATVGGPCLSGSGAYGHGLAVAPERNSEGKWLVADPWCKPPKWSWVAESKLKAGAVEWADRCSREAGGRPLRELDRALLAAVVRLLMDRYRPDRPALDDPPPSEVGGGGGVLFASTHPRGGTDVAINTNGSHLESTRAVHVGEGLNYYADAALNDQLGELGQDREVAYIGPALGADSPGVAILLTTSLPYDDDVDRPTIVYVNPEYTGEPYQKEPEPTPPPSDDVEAALAARDAEWIAWVQGMPDSMAVQVGDLPELLAWAQSAPAKPAKG